MSFRGPKEKPLEGPIWDDLYARFGKEDNPGADRYVEGSLGQYDRLYDGLRKQGVYDECVKYAAEEFQEMERIGVPFREAVKAVIAIHMDRNRPGLVRSINIYLPDVYTGDNMMVEVAKYLFDIRAMDALWTLEYEFILPHPDDEVVYPTWHGIIKSTLTHGAEVYYLPYSDTNLLGRFVIDVNHDVHLGLVEHYMDSGYYELVPPEDHNFDSPMLLALLGHTCLPVMKLMAQRDAPFRHVGLGNRYGIPDTLLVAAEYNPNMLPFLLKVGGMALEVPVKVSLPDWEWDDNVFVCCQFRRFRGMLELLSEFSLVLPLCADCKEASHLQSSVETSLFSSSQLLIDDFPLPENYPELYCEYLRFEDSPFDSLEFVEAMTERNPEEFQDAKKFLVPGHFVKVRTVTYAGDGDLFIPTDLVRTRYLGSEVPAMFDRSGYDE